MIDRRTFLRSGLAGATSIATAAVSLSLTDRILADPYDPATANLADRLAGRAGVGLPATPVRIRGVVRGQGSGIGSVAITDGLDVVDTAADGTFEMITTTDREFVSMCIPSGWQIPRNPTGTARHYLPVSGDGSGEMQAVFDLQPLATNDDRHALFLLADVQTEDTEEMRWFHERSVPDVIATREGLGDREMVGIACGDIMYDHLELYGEYERGVERMDLPFFQVVGNHDLDLAGLTDAASTRTFCRHFGPTAYSFDRGAIHYVVIDNVFWNGKTYFGYIPGDTLTWLERDLARVEAGRTVIVALHIPLSSTMHARGDTRVGDDQIGVANRDALLRLLEPYRVHVLAGHTHESEHTFVDGIHENVNGAVCGAWWTGPICADGAPNGFSLYEIDGEDVTWRYKSTGHGFDHQMRVYARGADPAAPDEIVANVWNWDPEWEVVWYEDGARRGAMARRDGLDPLSVRLHAGADLPEHNPWVDPYPTRHLFYAPVAAEAGEIVVEATDRFGNVYSDRVRY